MGFWDNMKSGVNQVGSKAKLTVEINRLKMEISNRNKELEKIYKKLGEEIIASYEISEITSYEELLQKYLKDVNTLKNKIKDLELEILHINNNKVCPTCKSIEEVNVKFCSSCGFQFENKEQDVMEDILVEDVKLNVVLCVNCNTETPSNVKFCGNCGANVAVNNF